MARWIGVKEGIKLVLVDSLREAFTNSFWAGLNPNVAEVNPKTVVLDHYPEVRQEWPLVRVGVQISSSHWGNISMAQRNGDVAEILGKGTFSVDMFALSPQGRDRLSDAMTALMLLREAYPGENVFDQRLKGMADAGYPLINLDKGTLSFGADAEGTGLEWEPNEKVYSSSLSAGFVFEWAMPIANLGRIIREVDTTVHMEGAK